MGISHLNSENYANVFILSRLKELTHLNENALIYLIN